MLEAVATIDFTGYSDYYSGHGHAFRDEDLVACIRFAVPVDYSETADQLIDLVMEDINGIWHIEYLPWDKSEEVEDQYSDQIRQLNLRKAVTEEFRACYGDDMSVKPLFDHYDELHEEEVFEYPSLIGYVHIYRCLK